MSWDNPVHGKILELEEPVPQGRPHLHGYTPLFEAVDGQGSEPRW